jgi:hypothetical protein
MVRAFDGSEPSTALRAYLVLIGCAARNETMTYGELAKWVKRGGPNLLSKPLDLLTVWCKANGLPALASLVVEQSTGLPAPGFTVVLRADIPAEQKRVWECDWFSFLPPTATELAGKSN